MVMHARKIPRLNDGYYDRGQTHSFEERSKGREGEYNDRYRKEHRDSSPRYQNKSSYLDRTKERLDRGNSDSPADKRINHHSSSSSKDHGSGSRYPNSSGRASSSSASTKERKTEKVHKAEVQKSALRICGDWSEHLSSSKKRYYYNCKTEESKWEKPKDWNDGKAVKTNYGRAKEAEMASYKTSGERHKHSSASQSSNQGNSAHAKRHPPPSSTMSRPDCSRQSAEDMDISPGSTPTEESVARNLVMPGNTATPPASMATGNATSVAMSSLISQLGDKSIQRVNSQELTQQAIQTLQKLQEALLAQQRQQQQQLAQLLTQQIQQQQQSTANASSNSNSCQNQESQHHNTSSQHHNDSQHSVTENGGQSPVESEGTPYGSPDLRLPEDPGITESSEKDTSQENMRAGSVSPSQCSSHKGYSRSLQAASLKKAEAYKLPPSLANYYNESLIQHVAGWPNATTEAQADQMMSNSHTVGNLYSTQVSADLKKARSLVRVSEIQSTLQEQRILFLRHQTRDLENLRSSGAFMPPHSAGT